MKITNFRGELTDISAKKEALSVAIQCLPKQVDIVRGNLIDASATTESLALLIYQCISTISTSAVIPAEISARSPRKLCIFIID